MDSHALLNIFIFLVTACMIVPIAGRFKMGAVLGYLLSGILIGPYAFGFIENPQEIMHFAEFGVIMMLFLIGLELEPKTLWRLRKTIVGLGSLQMLLTSAALAAVGVFLGFSWELSLTCGMALALSSTAIVLQSLEEKSLLKTEAGESAFSVLLFQDIAVIFILIMLPVLAGGAEPVAHSGNMLESLPGFLKALAIASIIGVLVIGGRFCSHSLFSFIAKTHIRELFTAISLALVVGITLLMQAVGLSPALGAFLAGVVLANSEYKHSLETDIQPFKGLLLGLFFISVGMNMDFSLFAQKPGYLLLTVSGFMLVKMLILAGLGRFSGLQASQNSIFAFALCQGGEFAFVLFQYGQTLQLFTPDNAAFMTLAVAVSMALTPPLMLVSQRYIVPRFMSILPQRDYDVIEDEQSEVIIAGYGRFSQIIGRFLTAQRVRITILEKNPEQIDLLRKFGVRAYFGDASRADLLRAAGAAKAKLLIITLADMEKCLDIVRMARREFPNLRILVRARNRRHVYELHKAGANYSRRELFDSSLTMAQEAMKLLGGNEKTVKRKAMAFAAHDEGTLWDSFDFYESEDEGELITFTRKAAVELEHILLDDLTPEEQL